MPSNGINDRKGSNFPSENFGFSGIGMDTTSHVGLIRPVPSDSDMTAHILKGEGLFGKFCVGGTV